MGCSGSKLQKKYAAERNNPMGTGLASNDNRRNSNDTESDGYVEHTFDKRWDYVKDPENRGQPKELGSGGFSTVYLVRNRKTSKLAAVKVMKKSDMDDEDKQSVLDEVNIMRKLQHPNIVQFIDFFDEELNMYAVIEYLEGGTMFDRVVKKESYNEKDARDLVYIFLSSLKYCHSKDIVHRDIKPENILMASNDDDADVKIADFGLSIHLPNGELCYRGCGTPNYLAPEMLKNIGYSKPVDMWAVGCIAFILLGGYAPFDCDGEDPASLKKLYSTIKKGDVVFEKEYFGHVSIEAKHLITSLLNVDPSERLTVDDALKHPWIMRAGNELAGRNLQKSLKIFIAFRAKRKFKGVVKGIIATNKFKNIIKSIGAAAKIEKAKQEQEQQNQR